MEAYFAFTDESGQYQKLREEKFLKAHPFYVRSTVIVSWTDYLQLQDGIDKIKMSFGLDAKTEVKWSHYGNAIKGNYKGVQHHLSPAQLKDFFSQALLLLSTLQSAEVYYTITDNRAAGQINDTDFLKMHLQNALQRVQTSVSKHNGYAIMVADDLNEETKTLKQAVYKLMSEGDYVQYTNVKKGFYIDFSNQCPGLQIADICAGIFTASLKYEKAAETEKHKYQCGHDLFFLYAYKKTRSYSFSPPNFEVYRYGVKEIPQKKGSELAKTISKQIADKLEQDLQKELFSIL